MGERPYPMCRCDGMIIIWIRTVVRVVRVSLSREVRHVLVLHVVSSAERGGDLFICPAFGQKGAMS